MAELARQSLSQAINGRQKKRAAASRYFQRNKQELYDKRTRRMQMQQIIHGLFQEDMAQEMAIYKPKDSFLVERMADRTMRQAKRVARFLHDFHPRDFKDWRPRYRWMLDFDGQLKPYLIRGPHREEVKLRY